MSTEMIFTRITLIACLISSALALCPCALASQDSAIPKNRVLVFPNGSKLVRLERPLEGVMRNTRLRLKDDMRSDGTRGIDFIVGDVETVRMKPKSRIILAKLPPEDPKPHETYTTSIKIEEGTLLVRGSEAFRSSRFQVSSRLANAGARGTSFAMRMEGGEMFVLVAEGLAELQDPKDPTKRLIVRHGQKATIGNIFPEVAERITPEDLVLYQELLSLPGSGRETDLRNDLQDADISELYVKRWDPLGRWAALPPLSPPVYDDAWRPDLLSVARFSASTGTSVNVPRDQFATIDDQGLRKTFEKGFFLMGISPDGQNVFATDPKKGLWSFDFLQRVPGRKLSSKVLADVQIAPDGKRLVASVGFKVENGVPVPARKEWVVLDLSTGADRTLIKLESPLFVRARWCQGGRRLIAVAEAGNDSKWIDGDSSPPKVIHVGNGDLSPLTGTWIFSTGFETAKAVEYTVVRTTDGQKWKGEAPKPLSVRLGGKWTAGDESYLESANFVVKMGVPPMVVPLPPTLRQYRAAPLAFSPDGRFYCYIEYESERLIVGDVKQPERIFDTGVILFSGAELTWLPVGDTIAYKRTWMPPLDWKRRDIAGTVELGAIRLDSGRRSTFSANPRDEAIILMAPPFQDLDVKVVNAAGVATGTAKAGTMSAFLWSQALGTELLENPQGGYTSAGSINSTGTIAGNYEIAGRMRYFVWTRSAGYKTLPEGASSGYGKLSDNGLVLNDIERDGNRHAAYYDIEAQKTVVINEEKLESRTESINSSGEILYSVGEGGSRKWFTFKAGVSREVRFSLEAEQLASMAFLDESGTSYLFVPGSPNNQILVSTRSGDTKEVKVPTGVYASQMAGVTKSGSIVLTGGNRIFVQSGPVFRDLRQVVDLGILGEHYESEPGLITLYCYSVQGNKLVCKGWTPNGTVSFLVDLEKATIWKLPSNLESIED